MKKKGLSLLLALSMVFTMNAVAFAGETTDEVVVTSETVEIEKTQSKDAYEQSDNSYYKQTSWADGESVSINGTTCVLRSDTDGVFHYTGKKFKASDLGLRFYDNDTKYGVAVKNIKNSGKAKATGAVTFSLKSLGSYKTVYSQNGDLTVGEAKAALKALKTKFKSAKGQTFTAYVAPTYINDSISIDAVKNLKNLNKASVSSGDLAKYVEQYGIDVDGNEKVVYIKTKNGTVKKVQLVYLDRKAVGPEVYKYSVKTKNLKKGTDYVVSGDSISFENSDSFSGVVIKAK